MEVKDKLMDIKDKPIDIKSRTVVGLPIRRDEVVEMLTACYGENLLELEEFERRVTEVEKATSLEEIDLLILDLPNSFLKNLTLFEKEELKTLSNIKDTSTTLSNPKENKESKKSSISNSNFNSRKGKLGLRKNSQKSVAILGERRLSGDLIKSNELYFVAIMGSVRADFSTIEISEDIFIKVTAIMGEIRITVPKNVKVIFDVTPIMGEAKADKGVNSEIDENSPVIRITGTAIMGEIRVISI